MTFKCPSIKNRCDHCLMVAKIACKNVLDSEVPQLLGEANDLLVENAYLQALVEEQGGIDILSRIDRQQRAYLIGVKAAGRIGSQMGNL